MDRHSSTAIHLHRSSRSRHEWRALVRIVATKLAFMALILLSTLQLGGCRAVEAIFKVGVWFGIMIIVTSLAVIGGVVALIMRRT